MEHILRCHEIADVDIVRGKGCYLYDVRGKRYTDFEAGSWSTALGHNHRRINHVMQSQIERIIHLGCFYPNTLAEDAAVEVLNTVAHPRGKCIFLSSGSEAVEFGVQAARRITGKPFLLALSDSYMAAYGSAGRKSPEEWILFDWGTCTTCPRSDGCDAECSHMEAIPFERIGGLVFELGGGPSLVRFPPKQLIQTLVCKARQHHSLVMANEVTAGLGRTGAWYGFRHYDLQPDIVVLGKGLGNGYPVSAVAMSGQVADELENSALHYAQSHENDPLGCVIAKEVIHVIREDELISRSDQMGALFMRELGRLAERHVRIKEVRGRGLMIAVEFETQDARFSVTSVYRGLVERGFLVGYSSTMNLLRFDPALIIEKEDIVQLVQSLDHILEDLR